MQKLRSGHCHAEANESPDETTAVANHNRCAGVYPRPGGGLYVCPCPRHTAEVRCRYCLHDFDSAGEGYDFAARRCEDHDACNRRAGKIRADEPEVVMAREASRAGKRPGRDCECGCGGQTRGGRFQPGHDAKLKGSLLRRAAGGETAAQEELRRRGWEKR